MKPRLQPLDGALCVGRPGALGEGEHKRASACYPESCWAGVQQIQDFSEAIKHKNLGDTIPNFVYDSVSGLFLGFFFFKHCRSAAPDLLFVMTPQCHVPRQCLPLCPISPRRSRAKLNEHSSPVLPSVLVPSPTPRWTLEGPLTLPPHISMVLFSGKSVAVSPIPPPTGVISFLW